MVQKILTAGNHLLNKKTGIGAQGLFNIWNFEQTQLSTGNPEVKVCTVSHSCLDSKRKRHIPDSY